MPLSEQDQRKIIEQEGSWVDPAFGGIDLSQFPHLQSPLPARSRDDGRFARDWRDTALSARATELRKFVLDPDTESLERVGKEIGNEGFRDEVRQRKGESVATAFKRACPAYLATDNNYRLMATTLGFNALPASQQEGELDEVVADLIDAGFWTVTNLTATYLALDAEGLLDVPAGTARQLSSSERLRVTRLAQSGRVDQAIGEYLNGALDGDGEELGMELLNDPAYRQVCDEAVWNVFADITYDYVPSAEREAYMQRHCAGRPETLALLHSAWAACQKHETSYARQEILDQVRPETQPPTERELDALQDNEIDALYQNSLRHYADQVRRRAPGVLA